MLFNNPIASKVLLVYLGVLLIWLIYLTYLMTKYLRFFDRLAVGATQKATLSEIMKAILDKITESNKKQTQFIQAIKKVDLDNQKAFCKIGLVHFNPFADTGGAQSFILAILNSFNDGVILSSLHSRSGARWYTKVVKNGKGLKLDLSNEEQEAVKKSNLWQETN